MKNTLINKAIIRKIARGLGELNEQIIYVGGATVSLYIDDPAADDVRPTKDIDISIKVASIVELEHIRELLTKKGFKQSADLDVMCRFKYEDILVDVMATRPISWAPANRWFEKGFQNLQKVNIEDCIIQIMPLSFFWQVSLPLIRIEGVGTLDLVMILKILHIFWIIEVIGMMCC
ncbi:MAG: hypothetical protein LUE98_11210 [Tannerellaceae bacterium]|nr:hypothetical protein [Tannerellaceae bacterium]